MNFSYGIACFLVGMNCVERASGVDPQMLFAPNMIWLWWLPAGGWFVCSLVALCTMFGLLRKPKAR